MNAPWRTADEIIGSLRNIATAHFATFSPSLDKRTHFVLGGWEVSASGELAPFVGVVSNFVSLRIDTPNDADPRHHIPTYPESATAAPNFQAWIERFRNISDRHYVVNVMGDCKPEKLQEGFRGLEGLLKKHASAERIGAACRQIALEAADHSERETIGRNLITVEMDNAGNSHCSYHPEHGADIVLVPDILSTKGCSTRTTITATADGKIRIQGKIAKAV